MKQLELAKRYFEEYGRPMIERQFPQLKDSYAAGLAGEGSGCLGYDDEISQDHDFAPGFCIWLSDEDFDLIGAELQAAYDRLPEEFMEFSRKNIIDKSRLGVMTVSRFYRLFTGCPDGPKTNLDWFLISESNLAAAVSGEVFVDGSGRFSDIRRRLLDFYPPDVLYKKLAARAAVLAQSGQYNLQRCLKRKDRAAAELAKARFCEAAISTVFLLSKRPAPFYKWAYKGMTMLPGAEAIAPLIKDVLINPADETSCLKVEAICVKLLDMMASRGFIRRTGSDFTQDYIGQLMAKIEDPQIKRMHPMADCPV